MWLPRQRSLSDQITHSRLIVNSPRSSTNPEILAKTGPIHFEIVGPTINREKIKWINRNRSRTYSLQVCFQQPGWVNNYMYTILVVLWDSFRQFTYSRLKMLNQRNDRTENASHERLQIWKVKEQVAHRRGCEMKDRMNVIIMINDSD